MISLTSLGMKTFVKILINKLINAQRAKYEKGSLFTTKKKNTNSMDMSLVEEKMLVMETEERCTRRGRRKRK